MTVYSWPAVATFRGARFWISGRDHGGMSPVNRRAVYSPASAELWRASLEINPMTSADARTYAAYLERLQGKVHSISISLAAGIYSALGSSYSGAINGAVAAQTDTIAVDGLTNGVVILPGTLLTVGTLANDGYQLHEVMESVTVSGGAATLTVAPYVRYGYADNAAVALGTAVSKWKLLDDGQTAVLNVPGYASHRIELVEDVS